MFFSPVYLVSNIEIGGMKYTLLLLAFMLTEAKAQNRYDVVITEIMADPSPAVGLPGNEWIELKNRSAIPINLQNLRIGDASGRSGPLPSYTLQPGDYVIICSNASLAAMEQFGNAIPVGSFPGLDNAGDLVYLATPSAIIHAVQYSTTWYRDDFKKEGGWSLEMIDTDNPCMGEANWKASDHIRGGTPGSVNSVNGPVEDVIAPKIRNAYAHTSDSIVIVFNEPVGNLSASDISNYSIEPNNSVGSGPAITGAIVLSPLYDQVRLALQRELSPDSIYTIKAANIADCKGNFSAADNIKIGLPAVASTHDIIINEILFNPVPNGFDFVEIYNNSNKIVDAAKLFIANRNSMGIISSIGVISTTPYYIFPGDHIVITENADRLALNYLVRNPQHVLTTSLPSYPDNEGTVILLNQQGEVIDEVAYKDDWHFSLLDTKEGVSLERIEPSGPSQDASNWHSAASTAGYGTPTYRNSQFRVQQAITATIEISPLTFSPDNDGIDDLALIQYRIDQPGYVANIVVFDAWGRTVKTLVKNGTMSTSGHWTWNGLNDQNQSLPIGIYVILTEIFNADGKKQRFKNTVVLARKLQ